jgi:hypothetical protein
MNNSLHDGNVNPYQSPDEPIVRAELVPLQHKPFPWGKFYLSLVACIAFLAVSGRDALAAQEVAFIWIVGWSVYGCYWWFWAIEPYQESSRQRSEA